MKEKQSIDISIETNGLAPGAYSLDLVLNETNEFGTERLLDVVRKSVGFNINAVLSLMEIWNGYHNTGDTIAEKLI